MPPVLGERNPQGGEENVEALLRRAESGIEQQGTAEGKRGGGRVPGLLLGKRTVIPELGGSLLQEGGIREEGAVSCEGIERMARAKRLACRSRLIGNRSTERSNNNQG